MKPMADESGNFGPTDGADAALSDAELTRVDGGAFSGYLKIPDIDGESLRSATTGKMTRFEIQDLS